MCRERSVVRLVPTFLTTTAAVFCTIAVHSLVRCPHTPVNGCWLQRMTVIHRVELSSIAEFGHSVIFTIIVEYTHTAHVTAGLTSSNKIVKCIARLQIYELWYAGVTSCYSDHRHSMSMCACVCVCVCLVCYRCIRNGNNCVHIRREQLLVCGQLGFKGTVDCRSVNSQKVG